MWTGMQTKNVPWATTSLYIKRKDHGIGSKSNLALQMQVFVISQARSATEKRVCSFLDNIGRTWNKHHRQPPTAEICSPRDWAILRQGCKHMKPKGHRLGSWARKASVLYTTLCNTTPLEWKKYKSGIVQKLGPPHTHAVLMSLCASARLLPHFPTRSGCGDNQG
jgi:hypothetical protein